MRGDELGLWVVFPSEVALSEDGTNNTASEGENVVQAGAVHGDVHVHASGGSQSSGVVPHQLPAPSRHFVDRTVEQDALTTLAKGLGTDNSVVVSVIDGLAGWGSRRWWCSGRTSFGASSPMENCM